MTFESLVRSAVFTDQRPLSGMLQDNHFVHRHLDWREPLSWIGSPPFLVLERRGELAGALACPPDPPGVAWVRLFMTDGAGDEREVWQALWEAALRELSNQTGNTAAAIAMKQWLTPMLVESGFTTQQQLVMLEQNGGGLPEGDVACEQGISIRPMLTQDLPVVADVDASAFDPLWQNSLPALSRAYSQAFLAAVAEAEGQVIGYHLSTHNSLGVHLARLAVRPEIQGRGIGHALVQDLILQAERRGIRRFTVNTQNDNAASLAIYKKLGFFETGERYPVYRRQVSQ
ncbi:MAG: GNAT family N-acetyltransferase [Chloroflexota bacterium]